MFLSAVKHELWRGAAGPLLRLRVTSSAFQRCARPTGAKCAVPHSVSHARTVWTNVSKQRQHLRGLSSSVALEEQDDDEVTKPIDTCAIDHVCISVLDMKESVNFYKAILGLELAYSDCSNFWPVCESSPAFLQRGSATVALLQISAEEFKKKQTTGTYGEHFAMQVSRDEFQRARNALPKLLKENDGNPSTIEEYDYGHQLSVFFNDLDHNVIEITTRVTPEDPERL